MTNHPNISGGPWPPWLRHCPSEYEDILTDLKSDSYPNGFTKDQKRILRRKKAVKYSVNNEILVKKCGEKNVIVLKSDEIPNIMQEIHDNVEHQCSRYSYSIAKERDFWPAMLKQIEHYVDNCIRCQKNQPTLKAPTTPCNPFQSSQRCGFVWEWI